MYTITIKLLFETYPLRPEPMKSKNRKKKNQIKNEKKAQYRIFSHWCQNGLFFFLLKLNLNGLKTKSNRKEILETNQYILDLK